MTLAWVEMDCLIKRIFAVTFAVHMHTLRKLENMYFVFELGCNDVHFKGTGNSSRRKTTDAKRS